MVVGVIEEPLWLGRCGDCAASWGTSESWLSRDIFCIPDRPNWRWVPLSPLSESHRGKSIFAWSINWDFFSYYKVCYGHQMSSAHTFSILLSAFYWSIYRNLQSNDHRQRDAYGPTGGTAMACITCYIVSTEYDTVMWSDIIQTAYL